MAAATELRQAVADLSTLAAADLNDLWRQVSTAEEARDALLDVLPALSSTYSLAAGTVAADWYDEQRDTLNISGRFSAIVADLDDQGADVLARWGVSPLFTPEADWRRAQVLIDGGLQLRIANAARYTVSGSAVADPQARGWQRQGDGKSCAFCSMLIARGAVYRESTAAFAAHDHCGCVAVPAWDGHPVPVKPYTPSERVANDADRARVRQYLKAHHAG